METPTHLADVPQDAVQTLPFPLLISYSAPCAMPPYCRPWKAWEPLHTPMLGLFPQSVLCVSWGSYHNTLGYKASSLNQYLKGWRGASCALLEWIDHAWTVREITKSSNTFSATNFSSNMIWFFFQLHDTIKMDCWLLNGVCGFTTTTSAFIFWSSIITVRQRKKVTAVTFFPARPHQTAQIRAKYARFVWMKSRDVWYIEWMWLDLSWVQIPGS